MHLQFRNANDAFRALVERIYYGLTPTIREHSRYGEVLHIPEPIILTYSKPLERVLFNKERDANPFLHLYESLWMLAGRNDVAPLAYYTQRMMEFSDDGKTLNGAYGYRWRYSAQTGDIAGVQGMDMIDPVDQLTVLINHLKRKPESRRAVLQMWNVEDDLLKIDTSKDTACNLSVLFQVEMGKCRVCNGVGYLTNDANNWDECICPNCNGTPHNRPRCLNMTVFNRSNDLIWGALGSNVVHFSFLQEYVAAHLGVEVGVYHQISNNLHVYTKTWEPERWLSWDAVKTGVGGYEYCGKDWKPFPLVRYPAVFDREIPYFVERNSGKRETYSPCAWTEPFLNDVAQPMLTAFRARKEKWGGGWRMWADQIKAEDWRIAATGWLERRDARKVKALEKNDNGG